MDERTEGIYVTPMSFPPRGTLGNAAMTRITRIERVNGDCTVTTIILTPLEVVHVLAELRELAKCL